MPEKNTLTLKDVAAEIGKHPETVRRYLAQGLIHGRRTRGDTGDWIVTRKSLDQYLDHHYDPRAGR